MEKTLKYASYCLATPKEGIRNLGIVLFGSLLIVLASCIKIPMYPVPFTLQTLAIYVLSLVLSPKQAFTSSLCFLLYASAGLPVFCGQCNPFWLIGKSGGYLIAFPFAAYCIAWMRHKSPSMALIYGTILILGIGFLWLIPFLGWQVALIKGVLIFIPSSLLKIVAARKIASW